jgi:hypothetical protein
MPVEQCEEMGGRCVAVLRGRPDVCCCYAEEVVVEQEFEEKFERGTYTAEKADDPEWLEGIYVQVKRDPQVAFLTWRMFFSAYASRLGMSEAEARAFSLWRSIAMLLWVGEEEAAIQALEQYGACLIISGWLVDKIYTPSAFSSALAERITDEFWRALRRASRWYISLPPKHIDELFTTLAELWGSPPEDAARRLIDAARRWGASPRALYNNVYYVYRCHPDEWLHQVERALDRLTRRR